MAGEKKKPYCPRIVSENDVGVHKSLGLEAQTCRVGIPRPMPGIVILVHGVNDVGEAYQNQEKGIIAGLKKRLNRPDFYAHEWKDYRITVPGRSPIIPFYWGYKPVTREEYMGDSVTGMRSASYKTARTCRLTRTRKIMRLKKPAWGMTEKVYLSTRTITLVMRWMRTLPKEAGRSRTPQRTSRICSDRVREG